MSELLLNKPLPQSQENEQCILGCLIIDNDICGTVFERLEAGDFLNEDHRIIFDACKRLHYRNVGIDLVTLRTELKATDQLQEAGNIGYVAQISESVPSAANWKYYCHEIKRLSILRKIIVDCDSLINEAFSPQADVKQIMAQWSQNLETIDRERNRAAGRDQKATLASCTGELIQYCSELATGQIKSIPVPWPSILTTFNNAPGIPPETVGLIGSLSKHGKTWMVYQWALHAAGFWAIPEPLPVYVLNTEMSERLFVARLYAIADGNPQIASLNDPDIIQDAVNKYYDLISSLPLQISPPIPRTLSEAYFELQRKAKEGYRLLFVDHLTQLSCHEPYREQPEFVKKCSYLAKREKVVIVVVSHLKEGIETGDIFTNSKQLKIYADWVWLLRKLPEFKEADLRTCGGTVVDKVGSILTVALNRYGESDIKIGLRFLTDGGIVGYSDMGLIRKI